jgi:hypothetical protein
MISVGTRYSMQNGEALISTCPTKNVPQLSNIKHNINDDYKRIDEIEHLVSAKIKLKTFHCNRIK